MEFWKFILLSEKNPNLQCNFILLFVYSTRAWAEFSILKAVVCMLSTQVKQPNLKFETQTTESIYKSY
jgi:hypothetical protein